MNNAQLQQLADIELPPAPTWHDWLPYWLSAAAITLLLIAVIWSAMRRRRAIPPAAESPISTLNAIEQDTALAPRERAYRVAHTLRRGLHLTTLDHTCPDTLGAQHREWTRIIAALSAARYHPRAELSLHADDFAIMRTWLQHAANAAERHHHV